LDEALLLLEGVAKALSSLHQHDTYHLNLKPANILIDDGSKVVLADVGLTPTVLEGLGRRGSTFLDQVMGPANYM
jgi:serine/threonine protein kinase